VIIRNINVTGETLRKGEMLLMVKMFFTGFALLFGLASVGAVATVFIYVLCPMS